MAEREGPGAQWLRRPASRQGEHEA
jgi:hypothetical protein